jgi:hypothetical protein
MRQADEVSAMNLLRKFHRRDAETQRKQNSQNRESARGAQRTLRRWAPREDLCALSTCALRIGLFCCFLCVSASLRCNNPFLAASASAAVTGTVINKTTGKPQAGATVALNKLGQQLGIEMIDQAKSGPDGSFTINQDIGGGGTPYLIRAAFDGVTYNLMIPPGRRPPA